MENWIVLCESLQDWFEFVDMYKNGMAHANATKKVQWSGIQLCENFGGTRLFNWTSGKFKGMQVVQHKEGMKYWGLDPFSTDAVNPCSY